MKSSSFSGEWISVKEKLPDRDGPVLIHAETADEKSPLIHIAWFDPDHRFTLVPIHFAKSITHWMFLPPNPKGE